MIVKFNTYNESVRDMMIPKSDEEIKKALSNLDKEELSRRLGVLFYERNYGEIRNLIKLGVKGDILDSLLTSCVPSHQVELLELVLANGADVNTGDDFPLRAAIYNNHEDIFKILIKYGANFERAIENLKKENERNNMMDTKLIRKYINIYRNLNESVRDMMQPKSKEDIRKYIDTLVPGEKLRKGIEFGVLTKQEARDMIDRLDPEFRLSYGLKYGLLSPREIHEVFITLPLINKIQLMYKTDYRYSSDKLMDEFMTLSTKDKEEILNLGDVSIYVRAGGSYREKFDKILKRLRKISSKNISRSKRNGRNNIVYVNESVRDMMKPKSETDTDKVLRKMSAEEVRQYLKKTCITSDYHMMEKIFSTVGYKINYFTYTFCLSVAQERKDTKMIEIIKNYWNNRTRYTKFLHSSDRFIGTNSFQIDESIRDQMTPKSKEEIMNGIEGDENVTFTPTKKGISGTFLVGEINMSYYDIVKLFGEPEEEAWIGNNFLWILQTNDNRIITIYDNGSGLESYEIMEMDYPWHIGGTSKKDFKDISYYIYNNILE